MMLKCSHCEREWDYKGSQEYYTCCPNCHYNVMLNWDEEGLELIRQMKELKKEKERGVGVGEQDYNIGEEEV